MKSLVKQLLLASLIGVSSFSACQKNLSQEAAEIHDEVLTIDTHCDTPLRMFRSDFDIGRSHDPRQGGGKVDLIRMRAGGLDAQFFAVYIAQGPRDKAGNQQAIALTSRIIDTVYAEIEQYPDLAEIALHPEDAYRLQNQAKRAIYLGIENGYAIGDELSLINKYYQRGIRYITLCHVKNNDICDSSNDSTEHGGLSPFGRKVVKRMNRIGMIIDISHASDQTFYDVIEVSQAPIIASHSCARAICDNVRNMSDAMLKELAYNGGVLQVCILSAYVKELEASAPRDSALSIWRQKYPGYWDLPEMKKQLARTERREIDRKFPPSLATVADFVDHIDHIVQVAGIDHVGIGTDFDGGGALKDCYDVSQMGNITRELLKRGYNKKEIAKIWGGNFMRVFRKVQAVAANSPTE